MKTAQTSRQYNAVDAAKFFCAILIVTIHFPPLGNAAVSPLAQAVNSFFRSYLGRIAVPFFLLSAGFFLFRKTASQPFSAAPSKAYVLRILRLYVLWTILYLPRIIREARESGKNLPEGFVGFLSNFLLTGSYARTYGICRRWPPPQRWLAGCYTRAFARREFSVCPVSSTA